MRYFKTLFLISALTLAATSYAQSTNSPLMLAAGEGMLTIVSPEDGAMLDSGSGDSLEYNISLSPSGNHIHVYIDNNRPIIVRKVSGCPCTLDLPDLSSGKHTIVLKEATSGHSLTGLEAAVTVTVK
jgi:hypothetical protein